MQQGTARPRPARLPELLSPKLLLALSLASLSMLAGFSLKWLYLLQPDPRSWYVYSCLHLAYTDLVALYLQQGLHSHPIPYLETRLEYPVVVGAMQYLVASHTHDARSYFDISSAILLLAGLATVGIVYLLDRSARLGVFAATPPLLFYAALNWDLIAIFFALLSLLLFQRRHDGWSALLLTLGVWTKLFPLVLLAWMVFQRGRERDWKSLALVGTVVVATSLALNLPVYRASPEGWRYFLDFQAERPPDAGSIWFRYPEWPVEKVNRLSLLLAAVGATTLGLIATWRRRGAAEFGLGSLALLVLVSKVTSPQYHLWLMPFFALVPAPAWLVGIFVGVDATYFWASYQSLYAHWMGLSGPEFQHTHTIALANAARQGTLLLVYLWVVLSMLRGRRSSGA